MRQKFRKARHQGVRFSAYWAAWAPLWGNRAFLIYALVLPGATARRCVSTPKGALVVVVFRYWNSSVRPRLCAQTAWSCGRIGQAPGRLTIARLSGKKIAASGGVAV